jgi:undecaprenyl-diphosphatase
LILPVRGRIGFYVLAAGALALAAGLAAARAGERSGQVSGWQALLLGIVQGLTEFLPISSSGHLILVPWAADWTYLKENDEFNATFDVALHIGTLVAVTTYFQRDLRDLLDAWLRSVARRRIDGRDQRVAWLVVLATVPAALVGAIGENFIVDRLGEPWQIAILLAAFGLILGVADRTPERRDMGGLRYGEAVGIGFAQALSLMPGVSRSGVTISAARFLGLTREEAARFSFLLLVPTTLGAVVWKGVNDVLLADLPPGSTGPFAVGVLAAAASGFVAIDALLGYVRRRDYSPFVLYRLAIALLVAGLIVGGVRDATF